jgi:hypothetical protein
MNMAISYHLLFAFTKPSFAGRYPVTWGYLTGKTKISDDAFDFINRHLGGTSGIP